MAYGRIKELLGVAVLETVLRIGIFLFMLAIPIIAVFALLNKTVREEVIKLWKS